jgi:hypothetical protein
MSEMFEEAYTKASEIKKDICLRDFNMISEITHGDESFFKVYYSFLLEYKDFVIVISEHNSTLVFHKEDVEKYETHKMFDDYYEEEESLEQMYLF